MSAVSREIIPYKASLSNPWDILVDFQKVHLVIYIGALILQFLGINCTVVLSVVAGLAFVRDIWYLVLLSESANAMKRF